MKSEELRALQAPLKEKYRQQPGAALITLSAEGSLGEGVTCKISTDQLATLLRLTERYCVVYQTLNHPPEVSISR